MLEQQGTEDLFKETGVGERIKKEGLVHYGIELRFGVQDHRIAVHELTGRRTPTAYGHHQVVRGSTATRLSAGGEIHFEAKGISVHDLGPTPKIRCRKDHKEEELTYNFIAGRDRFRAVCRPSIPEGVLTGHECFYPFAWLEHRLQLAKLDYVTSFQTGATSPAETYVGLPTDLASKAVRPAVDHLVALAEIGGTRRKTGTTDL